MRKPETIIIKVLLITFLILSFGIHAQPTFQWAKNMGGPGTDVVGKSINVDASGNVYTTGYIAGGTVDFDPSPGVYNLTSNGFMDFFIAKFDASGNFIWAKLIGGPSDDIATSIIVDVAGSIYVGGGFYSSTIDFDPGPGVFNVNSAGAYDIFILKLDSNGNFIWVKTMGGVDFDLGGPFKLDVAGNIYFTGSFSGTSDFDPGPGVFNLSSVAGIDFDIFVLKLNASGNFLWAKAMGGNGIDGGSSIDVDAAGNIYTTGKFEVTADFDPGSGTYNLMSVGDYDIFVSKLDANGNFIWAKTIGGAGFDSGNSICLDGAGNVYTTGFFKFTADFDPSAGGAFQLTAFSNSEANFISKLDANGNFIWAKTFVGTPPAGVGIGFSISTDAVGNVYSTGYFLGTFDFDPNAGVFNKTSVGSQDIFISKLDANGNFLCAGTIGGPANDVGICIATHTNGNLYATGSFSGTADFETDPTVTVNLTSTGSADVFVCKFLQNCLGTGINENDAIYNSLNIYPNPVHSVLKFTGEENVLENSEIEISNTLGQIILKLPFKNEIDVSGLSSGYYVLKIIDSDRKQFHTKFIKQ